MANTYYGKNGKLRIYDSTRGRDLSQSAPMQVHVMKEVSAVFTDLSADLLDPVAGTQTILAASADRIYVGNIFKFSRIVIDLQSVASADGGPAVVEYWNGSAFVAVSNLNDTTKISTNSMRQDGVISFDIPSDWAKNDPGAAGTNLYYIRIHLTSSTATDAVAQLVEPASGQYYEVVFEQMNLTAPEGHQRPEEIVRMNRNQLDAATHYVQGSDEAIMQGQPISFSLWLDNTFNKTAFPRAISCENAGLTDTWPLDGISGKTDTQLPAGLTGTLVNTPPFTDPTKKAVSIQAMWDDLAGNREFREYNEVHIPSAQVSITESPDSLVLQVQGGIFGSIMEDLTNFGYRY